MDFLFDILQTLDIHELQKKFDRLQLEKKDTIAWDMKGGLKALLEEVVEMKLRMNALVQLLIEKGILSAEEYAKLIAASRIKKKETF